MERRSKWRVEYTGAKLAEGARHQLDWRQKRLAFWKGRHQTIIQELKEKGLTIDFGAAEDAFYRASSNKWAEDGPRVSVDQKYQRHLSECHRKVDEHNTAVRNYFGWVEFLQTQPEATFKLTQEDWMFFFGSQISDEPTKDEV